MPPSVAQGPCFCAYSRSLSGRVRKQRLFIPDPLLLDLSLSFGGDDSVHRLYVVDTIKRALRLCCYGRKFV